MPSRLRDLMALGLLAFVMTAGCTDRVELGHQLYAAHGCAVCHGPAGRGDGPAARTLGRLPRDFADSAQFSQGASEEAIAGSIRNGVGAMPAFRDLSDDDARRLAAWILSLQTAGGSSRSGR
jgi:cytochrome c553